MSQVEMPGLLIGKLRAEAIEAPAAAAAPIATPVASPPKRDATAIILLAAVGLALAVTGGATLSGFATGALQAVVRSTGFGQGEALQDEQRRQARNVATLERKLAQMSEQMAGLARYTTVAAGAGETRTQNEFARIESDLAALRAELAAQRMAAVQAQATSDGPADPHSVALAQAGIGIAALRSSFDERDRVRGAEIAAVARRIDRLEQIVIAREVTGSVRPATAPMPRKRAGRATWSVESSPAGVSVVNEHGERFPAARGARVTGLGRITDVRKRGDRWIVVTRHGEFAEH